MKLKGKINIMKHELYKQLHEQYAVNNNANLSTVMTLIVALIAVIWFLWSYFYP